MEDIGNYEWGCFGSNIYGADETSIGSGYQNTMDIVNAGCSTENVTEDVSDSTAVQAALDAVLENYSDWYLPSKEELHEMYNTIGQEGPLGNVGGFEPSFYWSSSECDEHKAWCIYFFNGNIII